MTIEILNWAQRGGVLTLTGAEPVLGDSDHQEFGTDLGQQAHQGPGEHRLVRPDHGGGLFIAEC
jgi:hypothetical protein